MSRKATKWLVDTIVHRAHMCKRSDLRVEILFTKRTSKITADGVYITDLLSSSTRTVCVLMTQPWPIAVATIQSEQQTHNGRAGQRTQRLHARCLCPDNKLQGSCATRSISLQRARACLTVIAQRRHCRGMVIFCMIPDVPAVGILLEWPKAKPRTSPSLTLFVVAIAGHGCILPGTIEHFPVSIGSTSIASCKHI